MPTIHTKYLHDIKSFYNSGGSVKEIATRYKVSIDAVYYFFRLHKIDRRDKSSNSLLNFEKKKPSFSLKKDLTHSEELLKLAGVMLYWGEGSKWEKEKIVDFANSNVEMVQVFLKFLRTICGVEEQKIRVLIYGFANQDPKELIAYWSKITGIKKEGFSKPYLNPKYNRNKVGKMQNGLVHIRYGDKKLLNLLKEWIEQYKKELIMGRYQSGQMGLTVNQVALPS